MSDTSNTPNPTDRIRRAAHAVAELVGTHDHARYLEIAALVIYADESANNLEEWGVVTDAQWKRAVAEAVADLGERLIERKRGAARLRAA